eukprot:14337630-Ditylum_brightwellii.AAC.1
MIYWSCAANIGVIGLYSLCVLLGDIVRWEEQYGKDAEPSSPWTLHRVLLRLLLTHGCITILVVSALAVIDSTSWAQHLKSNTLFQPFFPEMHVSELGEDVFFQYVDTVASPIKSDLLIGTMERTVHDAEFLNHHGGNVIWKHQVEMAVPIYVAYSGLPPVFQSVLVDFVMYDSVVEQGGRFLKESMYGDWRRMSAKEARDATKKNIICESNRLILLLGEALYQLKTHGKHGRMSIMKKGRRKFVKKWEALLYSSEEEMMDNNGKVVAVRRGRSSTPLSTSALVPTSLAQHMITNHYQKKHQ